MELKVLELLNNCIFSYSYDFIIMWLICVKSNFLG